MTRHVLCPFCGHNFEPDAAVQCDGWSIDPYAGRASWCGVPVTSRMKHIHLLHTIAAAAPNIVSPDALLNRLSDSEDPNLARVMVAQMKKAWPAQVPWPIETVRGYGYRWVG